MTTVGAFSARHTGATGKFRQALDRPSLGEGLALAALGSLFVRSEWYPQVLAAGALSIRLQDLLFLALGVVALRSVGARPSVRLIPLLAAAALVPIVVAAARSPVRDAALISVSKLVEFVVIGALIMVVLRKANHPVALTATLAAGVLVNGLFGLGFLVVHEGLSGAFTSRTSMLVGTETAATSGAAVIVWSLVRSGYASTVLERRLASAGLVGGVLALFAAKSILAVAALPAVLIVALRLGRDRVPRVGAVAACIVLSVIVGRESDLTALARSEAPIGQPDTPAAEAPDPNRSTSPPSEREGRADPEPPERPPAQEPRPPSAERKRPITQNPRPPRAKRKRPIERDVTAPPARRGAAASTPDQVMGGSFVHRIALGHVGIQMFRENPLGGKGWLASSQPAVLSTGPYDRLMLKRFPRLDPNLFVSRFPTNVHNAYIQFAAEAGALALFLFVALLAVAISCCVRQLAAPVGRGDWWSIIGLGWLTLMVVYLQGNVLYGGTFNAALLGAGLAVAGTCAAPLPRRYLVIAAGVVLAIVGAMGGIVLRGPAAQAVTTGRVVATDGSQGREIFDGRLSPRWADLSVENGLVRLDSDGRRLRLTALDAEGKPTGTPLPLVWNDTSRPISSRIVQRRGDIITVLYRLQSRSLRSLTVSMVLGSPGLYVTPHFRDNAQPTFGLELGSGPALFIRDRTQRFVGGYDDPTPWQLDALESSAALTGGPLLATVVPLEASSVSNSLGGKGRPPRGLFVSLPAVRTGTVFFGLGPVPEAAVFGESLTTRGRLSAGSYLGLRRQGRRWMVEPRHVEATGAPPTWLSEADAAIPLNIADRSVLGADEMTELALTLRSEALLTACRPPPGEPPLCR